MKQLLFFFILFNTPLRAQSPVDFTRQADDKYAKGDYTTAAGLYEKALQVDSTNKTLLYNTACCHALTGNKQKAARYLQLAFQAGWTDAPHVFYDEDFKAMHTDTGWNRVMAPRLEAVVVVIKHDNLKLWLAFEAARAYARSGNPDKAFVLLERAMDFGWTGMNDSANMEGMEYLKQLPGWKTLQEKFKKSNRISSRNYLWGMYLGILFILFFYNLFLFLSLRDISFLYYSLMIFAYSQLEAIRTPEFGYYSQDIFVWHSYFNRIGKPFYFFITLSMLLHVLFARKFLNIKINNPRINKWTIGFIIYLTAQAIISLPARPIRALSYISPQCWYMFLHLSLALSAGEKDTGPPVFL